MSRFEEATIKKRKCPGCGSERVRRSQMRGFLERGVLRTVGLRAYRCESCDKRHYAFEGIEPGRGKLKG